MNTTTPYSGWLSKLSSQGTFSTARWQARYFVLLDSELRYYKDEHSIAASRTISLRNISRVVVDEPISNNHQYIFRLEPTLYYKSHNSADPKKNWTISCKSQYELDTWVTAVNTRLSKLLFNEEETYDLDDVISPSLQPFSTPEQNRQKPSISLIHAVNAANSTDNNTIGEVSAPDVIYSHPQPRPLKKFNPTISRRRGVILSALQIEKVPNLDNCSEALSSASSSTRSSTNTIPSPDSKSVPATIKEETDNDNPVVTRANRLLAHNAYVLDSPTFALYKECYSI